MYLSTSKSSSAELLIVHKERWQVLLDRHHELKNVCLAYYCKTANKKEPSTLLDVESIPVVYFIIRDTPAKSSQSFVAHVTLHMRHAVAATVDSSCSHPFLYQFHHCFDPNKTFVAATNIHFKLIHRTTDPRTIKANITAMNLPRISNASLTSNFATFLIFLLRCHDLFLFFVPDPSCPASFGLIASCGSTCPTKPPRPQLESRGSWYGSGSSQLDG